MTDTVGQPDWMTGAAPVMNALEAGGGPDCARFVGGCVRNSLIGTEVADVDIATRLSPQDVLAALAAARLKAAPTGLEHGTVTAISGGRPYEITTLRRDVETDGRRAVVAFTDDWSEDARRRDFTLNALYASRDGTIFDPTGQGVGHARAGRIVFVGDAGERIREDYLRILRFFRFLAWYGRGEPDRAAVAACAALKDGLAGLSAERVSKELLKLLAAADPRPAVELMAETGVLAVVLPDGVDHARFRALSQLDGDPVLRLAALLPDDPASAVRTAERLRLSNAQRDRLAAALTPEPELAANTGARGGRRLLYRLGEQAFRDRALLSGWPRTAALADGWTRPVLPVNGADALAAGIPRGPEIGEALKAVEHWWIAEDFPADRAAALAKLKAVPR
jgi:poly(A) polymerase